MVYNHRKRMSERTGNGSEVPLGSASNPELEIKPLMSYYTQGVAEAIGCPEWQSTGVPPYCNRRDECFCELAAKKVLSLHTKEYPSHG